MPGLFLLVVAVAWLADHGYARWVERRQTAWEAEIERGTDGLRPAFTPWQQGQGTTALLFVHGFAGAPSLFEPWGDFFADQGYTCEAIRLPGFGVPLEKAANVTANDWVTKVDHATERLQAEHDEVWIVAHSLGATVALQVAAMQPEQVDGLILLAPLLQVSATRSPLLSPEQWYRLGRRLTRRTRFIESSLPVDGHDPMLADHIQRDRYIPWAMYDALFQLLARVPPPSALEGIPLWIALAADDQVVDNAAVHEWFAPLAHPPNVLMEQAPAGHVLPQDTGWKALREEVHVFLAQLKLLQNLPGRHGGRPSGK